MANQVQVPLHGFRTPSMWPLPPRGDSTAFPCPPALQLLLTPPHSLPRMPCRTGSHLYSRTQAVPTGTPARDSKVKQHPPSKGPGFVQAPIRLGKALIPLYFSPATFWKTRSPPPLLSSTCSKSKLDLEQETDFLNHRSANQLLASRDPKAPSGQNPQVRH